MARRRICPKCGIEVPYRARFCIECGYHFPIGGAIVASEPSETVNETQPTDGKRYCPSCKKAQPVKRRWNRGILILLVILFGIPGLIYWVVKRHPKCTKCGTIISR